MKGSSFQQETFLAGSTNATVSRSYSAFIFTVFDGMMLFISSIGWLGLHIGAAKHLESDPAYTHSRIELAARRNRGRRSLVSTVLYSPSLITCGAGDAAGGRSWAREKGDRKSTELRGIEREAKRANEDGCSLIGKRARTGQDLGVRVDSKLFLELWIRELGSVL